MKGKDLKALMKRKRIYQWEVAETLGISEFTLSRWLRRSLSDEQAKAILEAIRDIEYAERQV